MKIKIDDVDFMELENHHKQVLCNDICSGLLEEDLKRRVKYILIHKYEQCLEKMKKEWIPKLKASGAKSIPLDDKEFISLVISQADYKTRTMKEAEEEELN